MDASVRAFSAAQGKELSVESDAKELPVKVKESSSLK